MRLEQLRLAAEVVLGGDQIGLGLAVIGEGVADVGRFDGRQRGALLHPLARLGQDPLHAAGHGREDVRDPQIVEGDLAAGDDLVADGVLADRLDLDLGVADLLGGQPDLALGRLPFGVGGGGRTPAAGQRRGGTHDAGEHRRELDTPRGHWTTPVAVAASIWKMASQ